MLRVNRHIDQDVTVSSHRPESFEMLVSAWLLAQNSPNTRAAYRRDLELFNAWFLLRDGVPLDATTADIDAFRLSCESAGASAATVNRRLAALSSFFRFVDPGRQDNPVDAAARPDASSLSSTAQLDPAQTASLWSAATALGSRTSTIVGLVLFDGLKTNEALLLDVDDVQRVKRAVMISVTRRAGRQAIVVDHRTATAMTAYIRGRRSGPLLLGESPTREPARLTRFGFDYLIKRSGQKAGFAHPLTANMLRSTHIANSHANGIDIHEVRNAVGHASVRTTRRYLRRDDLLGG
jgi:integrase/recombinase XerD